MSIVTDNWRLKLLAVGLAVLMLGVVAFSENPPRTKTLSVPLHYSTQPGSVLINPPTKTLVTVSGLADVVAAVTPDNLVALVDAPKANPEQAPQTVKVNVRVTSLITGISVQDAGPIAVNVDAVGIDPLTVQVIARPAPGWFLDKAVARCSTPTSTPDQCIVTFTGPASWEAGLAASVVYPGPVNVGSADLPASILLQNSHGSLDPSTVFTVPAAGLDVSTVSIHVEARPGSTSSTVPLVDSPPSQPPPSGYRVTGITISPITVLITGDAGAIGRIQRIDLPAVDLSGHVSDFTIQVAIVYPPGVTGSATTATIKYAISQNPNVSASP